MSTAASARQRRELGEAISSATSFLRLEDVDVVGADKPRDAHLGACRAEEAAVLCLKPHVVVVGIMVVVGGVEAVIAAPLVADTDKEIEMETPGDGERVAVGEADGVVVLVALHTLLVASELEVVGIGGEIRANPVTGKAVGGLAVSELPTKFHIAAIPTPAEAVGAVEPPCVVVVDEECELFVNRETEANLRSQHRVLKEVGGEEEGRDFELSLRRKLDRDKMQGGVDGDNVEVERWGQNFDMDRLNAATCRNRPFGVELGEAQTRPFGARAGKRGSGCGVDGVRGVVAEQCCESPGSFLREPNVVGFRAFGRSRAEDAQCQAGDGVVLREEAANVFQSFGVTEKVGVEVDFVAAEEDNLGEMRHGVGCGDIDGYGVGSGVLI